MHEGVLKNSLLWSSIFLVETSERYGKHIMKDTVRTHILIMTRRTLSGVTRIIGGLKKVSNRKLYLNLPSVGREQNNEMTYICPICQKPKLGWNTVRHFGQCFYCDRGYNDI